MLCRIAFSAPRVLSRKETRVVAWAFVLLGLCGFAMVLLINGSTTHRLMVLGGSITFFVAGLYGVWSRGHDGWINTPSATHLQFVAVIVPGSGSHNVTPPNRLALQGDTIKEAVSNLQEATALNLTEFNRLRW